MDDGLIWLFASFLARVTGDEDKKKAATADEE
jgi:hypothetical protein